MDRQHALENLVNAHGDVLDALAEAGEATRNRVTALNSVTDALGNSYEALSDLVEAIRMGTQEQIAALNVRIAELESQVSSANRADR